MTQPEWKHVASLGESDDHSLWVYDDETGEYAPELGHRICLDLQKEVEIDGAIYLVPESYRADWPHPVADYEAWFVDSLASVASFIGSTEDAMRADLCAHEDDGADWLIRRASAYQAIADYHGWSNFG